MVNVDNAASSKFTPPAQQKTAKPQSSTPEADTLQDVAQTDTFTPSTNPFSNIPIIPNFPPIGPPLPGSTLNYDGITIDTSNFTQDQLNQVKTALDALQNDPDGQKLMAFAKEHNQKIEFPVPPDPNGLAKNTGTAYKIQLAPQSFLNGGVPGLIMILGHEMTDEVHASQGHNDGDTVTGNVIASLIGTRIEHRYNHQPWSLQDEQAFYKTTLAAYTADAQSRDPNPVMGDPQDIAAFLFQTTGISIDPSVFAGTDANS
jgi:hypothetical protein